MSDLNSSDILVLYVDALPKQPLIKPNNILSNRVFTFYRRFHCVCGERVWYTNASKIYFNITHPLIVDIDGAKKKYFCSSDLNDYPSFGRWYRLPNKLRNKMCQENIWKLPYFKHGSFYYFLVCGRDCHIVNKVLRLLKMSAIDENKKNKSQKDYTKMKYHEIK